MKTSIRFTAALIVLALVMGLAATTLLVAVGPALAAGPSGAGGPSVGSDAWSFGLIAAAISAALAAAGAGFAVARVGTAAIGALVEKPELFGRLLIFVGLAEGIAIYGLIVSILILNRVT